MSTAPSITEMLFAIGAGPNVVGVTNFCHYPPEVTKLPKIGTYIQPNLEAILSLRPDLVVTQKNPVKLTERLQGLKLNTVELDYERTDGIFTSLQKLGAATGKSKQAEMLIADIRRKLDAIRARTANSPRVRVAFIVGRTPGALRDLIATGGKGYLDEILTLAGGVNIFADSTIPYPRVSLEEMIARKPDVIIDMGEMAKTSGVTEEQKRAVVQLWSSQRVIPAVRNGKVFAVASDILVVPGPRVADAALEFARMLHPEARF